MRSMKRLSWVMVGIAALAAGCQPEEEPSAPGTVAPQASRTEALTVGSWSANAQMSIPRSRHTATLLDSGLVLVAGRPWSSSASAELYNPYDDAWSPTGSMNQPRSNHTATRLGSGKVLVAGGHASNIPGITNAELYDPATGTWSWTGNLTTGRGEHEATLLDSGQVLLTGGLNAPVYPGPVYPGIASAELYDPATGTFSPTASMSKARMNHGATKLYSGQVLVTGGFSASEGPHGDAELYDPATGTWRQVSPMPERRAGHTATMLYSGFVLVAGGYWNGTTASVVLYDPYNDQWLPAPPMNKARRDHQATFLYWGQVLVTGGFTTVSTPSGRMEVIEPSAELYDPSTNTWTLVGNPPAPTVGHATTLLHTGEVLLTGGENPLNTPSPAVSRFTP